MIVPQIRPAHNQKHLKKKGPPRGGPEERVAMMPISRLASVARSQLTLASSMPRVGSASCLAQTVGATGVNAIRPSFVLSSLHCN